MPQFGANGPNKSGLRAYPGADAAFANSGFAVWVSSMIAMVAALVLVAVSVQKRRDRHEDSADACLYATLAFSSAGIVTAVVLVAVWGGLQEKRELQLGRRALNRMPPWGGQ